MVPPNTTGQLSPRDSARNQVGPDNESRFKNSIYPAKLWATYSASGLEVTAGDSYAQFGRGLTLSMRKVDELGIDTTIRGGKVQITRDPFSVTAVAGFANPSRVDEATGRSLWVTSESGARSFLGISRPDQPQAAYGSDRLVGLDLQAGRGLPVTLSTHAVRFSRCAPYHYDSSGNVETSFAERPGDGGTSARATDRHRPTGSGSSTRSLAGCRRATSRWPGSRSRCRASGATARCIVEAAVQQRQGDPAGQTPTRTGTRSTARSRSTWGRSPRRSR